jgi:hypothetical protein
MQYDEFSFCLEKGKYNIISFVEWNFSHEKSDKII